MLILMLVGTVMNPSDVRGGFEGQLQALMGPSAGEQVRTIIQQAEQKPDNGFLPTYSSLILLFGAEFTETWAERRGEGVKPEPGAVRIRREKQRVGELGSATR